MKLSTVSTKYQIVIPKDVRRRLDIKPGQKVSFEFDAKGKLVVALADPLGSLQKQLGARNLWGDDPVETVRALRDEWDA